MAAKSQSKLQDFFKKTKCKKDQYDPEHDHVESSIRRNHFTDVKRSVNTPCISITAGDNIGRKRQRLQANSVGFSNVENTNVENDNNQNSSRFGICPLCEQSFPRHNLEKHAATCSDNMQSKKMIDDHRTLDDDVLNVTSCAKSKLHDVQNKRRYKDQIILDLHSSSSSCSDTNEILNTNKNLQATDQNAKGAVIVTPNSSKVQKSLSKPSCIVSTKLPLHPIFQPHSNTCSVSKHSSLDNERKMSITRTITSTDPSSFVYQQLPPGLLVIPNFISTTEEKALLDRLDDPNIIPLWKMGRFNGQHRGKRWGVHCNLRDRRVDAPQHPLPQVLQDIIFPQLPSFSQLPSSPGSSDLRQSLSSTFVPNEANAIEYRRQRGDWLQAHVDDRKLSKEPILNLSLAGDCYMTFTKTKKTSMKRAHSHNNMNDDDSIIYKVWLPRRCLQILTGPSRYNYTHAIANTDLSSDRRVSITMRESPLTHDRKQKNYM